MLTKFRYPPIFISLGIKKKCWQWGLNNIIHCFGVISKALQVIFSQIPEKQPQIKVMWKLLTNVTCSLLCFPTMRITNSPVVCCISCLTIKGNQSLIPVPNRDEMEKNIRIGEGEHAFASFSYEIANTCPASPTRLALLITIYIHIMVVTYSNQEEDYRQLCLFW